MPDAVEFVRTIKKAALETIEASKPVNICFGVVTEVKPLKINVEQRFILNETQLILSRNVTDYVTTVSISWDTNAAGGSYAHSHKLTGKTENSGEPEHLHKFNVTTEESKIPLTHVHNILGKKEIIIHNSLAVGDEVILIRQQEGQKYLVLDRIG